MTAEELKKNKTGKFRFKVLVGKTHETIVTPENPKGVLVTWEKGEYITTDSDLVAKFNSSGSIKFERDHSYQPEQIPTPADPQKTTGAKK